ncbi:MAG: sensor histidine kinase [Planctomycetota bacterium]
MTDPAEPRIPFRVLIADDDPSVRVLLRGTVEKWGYAVEEAGDGDAAWAALEAGDPPRLAILDWLMPGQDGVDLCRRLQERDGGPLVYTILLTSKTEKEDIVHALDSGAHDFLSKPVYPAELRSRIAVGRRLVEAEEQISRYAAKMETLAQERARQLVHTERLATLGLLSAGVAHEINNPVGFISGNAQLIEIHWKKAIKAALTAAAAADGETRTGAERALRDMPEILDGLRIGVDRIRDIVSGLRRFSRKDTEVFGPCDPNQAIRNALLLCHNVLKYQVRVREDLTAGLPTIQAHGQRIEQVLVNLVSNAADAMATTGGGELTVRSRTDGDGVRIEVRDTGPGVPEDLLDQIWDPFYTSKPPEKGTGLGLSIAQGIVDEHGGALTAENLPEGGACFVLRLPLQPPAARPPAPA